MLVGIGLNTPGRSGRGEPWRRLGLKALLEVGCSRAGCPRASRGLPSPTVSAAPGCCSNPGLSQLAVFLWHVPGGASAVGGR